MLLDLLGINKVIKQIKCRLQKLENNSNSNEGDFIPLSGTTEGNPVTGDIEITSSINFTYPNDLGYSYGKLVLDTNSDNIGITNNGKLWTYPGVMTYFFGDNLEYQSAFSINGVGVEINCDDLSIARGIEGTNDYSTNYGDYTYIQKLYADKQHSYSTDEIKTGGTWIDGKPIYRKVVQIEDTSIDLNLDFGMDESMI